MGRQRIVNVACAWCGATVPKFAATVNRAVRLGVPQYCDSACFGLARRRAAPDRFHSSYMPEPMSGCWLWMDALTPRNYGVFSDEARRYVRAHRYSWELHNGVAVPAGLLVCHKCDNPPCVNPRHLFLGTHADNAADRDRKGRQSKGRKTTPKLTMSEASAIKRRLALGEKERALSVEYGVTRSAVACISQGRTWRDAP